MRTAISLPRPLVNQLLAQAQQTPRLEICGLISAHHGQAVQVYPINNIADQPQMRYSMDPQQQIAAMKVMRENDETLFAIYHSHPSSPAQPSATDIAEAGYPDAVYLIISLNEQGVLDMRGFHLSHNQVDEVELSLTD